MWVTPVTSHSKKVLIWISSWGLSLHIPVVSLYVVSGCLQKINLYKAILEMVPLSEDSTNIEIKKIEEWNHITAFLRASDEKIGEYQQLDQ